VQTGGSVFRILIVLALLAQQQQPPPTFRGGINLITLDITATGPDGWPVRDLRRDEVTLVVNGRGRPIKSFELMEVAPSPATKSATSSAGAPPAPKSNPASSSNVNAPGRSVFFVIMHEHICQGNERAAIDGATAFIDQLQSRDRVAVITMPAGRVEVDLTTDRAKAKSRLARIVGHAQQPTGNPITSETRALMDFTRSLAPLDGAKTIILISEGLNASESGLFTPDELAAIVPLPGLLPTAEQNGTLDLASATATALETGGLKGAAAAARAQFYVIRPNTVFGCGETDPASVPTNVILQEERARRRDQQLTSQETGLATVASVTGGQYFSLSARATGVFDRILRETSAYYTIAFEAAPPDLGSQLGKVQVRTSRPGVNVRVRLTLPKQPSTTAASASIREMSTTATTYREVPLWAAAFPARGANGQLKTPIVLDSIDRSWKEAAFTLTDSAGKVVAAWPADIPTTPAPIVTAQSIGPGHYRLRAAVIDLSDKRGTVDYEFDAKLEDAGPLKLGTMMVGTVTDGKFQPRLVSAAGSTVTGYFEIYGTAANMSVAFTLTRPGEDAPLVSAAGDLTATRDADRRIATGALPLRDLAEGDYTVKATVSVGGHPVGDIASALHVAPR